MNPMLLGVLNTKNVDQQYIIYLCLKIQRLESKNAIFSRASLNTDTVPEIYNDCKHLDDLDWKLIDSRKWSQVDDDSRHKKMAEALIKDRVDISDIDAIVVFNDYIKAKVKKIFNENNTLAPRLCYSFGLDTYGNYCFFYTKFFLGGKRKRETLITGPVFLLNAYKSLLIDIDKNRKVSKEFTYASIDDFITAVDNNFGCVKELEDIVSLKTTNPIHPETVDIHTKEVVSEVRKRYSNFSENDKRILVVAAYLHDIGKGPRSKWTDGIQKTYPDHPADAIPMLDRILSNEIESISEDNIRKICMLVVYHDIIGDCVCENRNEDQILEIITDENDLNLLFTLSLADTKTINLTWYQNIIYSKDLFKKRILEKLNLKKNK